MRLKPLRSLLFLPATATRMLERAHERGADAIVVDLEDSIVPDRKAEARGLADTAVRALAARGVTVLVRVNASADAYREDLERLPLALLDAVMLPKADEPGQVAAFDATLAGLERTRRDGRPLAFAALVESPRGVLAAAEIARASGRLCALGFGAEDYANALGVAPEPIALAWPAQQVITAAHAFGLDCWGLAASIAVVEDHAAFADSVRAARSMGFTGSVCIHPAQVPIVNAGFGPSSVELEWAARVGEADARARAAGQGAVLVDGRIIDAPIVERARRWIDAARG